jgi:hypothetical protein
MVMSGAPLTLGSGWDWPRILGVVAGSGMLVGGGIWAFKGYRRSKKWWLYSGLGLAGVGLATIAVSWWMARAKEQALVTQPMLTPSVEGVPGTQRRIAEGDQVWIAGDNARGRVVTVDDLADGSQQLSVELNGPGGPEERVVSAAEVRVL